MRRFLVLYIILCTCIAGAKAWDFAEPNDDGDTIYYTLRNNIKNNGEDSVYVIPDCSVFTLEDERYLVDTLRMPETVTHNGFTYKIKYCDNNIIDQTTLFESYLNSTKASPTTLLIPKTFELNIEDFSGKIYIWPVSNDYRPLNYVVDSDHLYLSSENGIIYTKNLDTLVYFPTAREGVYYMPPSVKYLTGYSFIGTLLDSLILSDKSDIRLHSNCIYYALKMKSFRYPNSITRLDNGIGICGNQLEEIILGSGLTYLGGTSLGMQTILKRVYCLAVNPPETKLTSLYGSDSLTLFVPRKSISLYRQAQGWSTFPAIEPIEPPVVSGVNNAEISWVTNAEASSYSLTLYLDSAQTRRLLTLTFDDRGYLQNMDINPDVYTSTGAPAFDAYAAQSSMPSRVRQAHEEETPETEVNEEQFNTYLSFTVTGLRAGCEYFFVRRTYNAMNEVIDEEHGSFETLTDTETGLDNGNTTTDLTPATATKRLQDGQVLIVSPEGSTYTPDGKELF